MMKWELLENKGKINASIQEINVVIVAFVKPFLTYNNGIKAYLQGGILINDSVSSTNGFGRIERLAFRQMFNAEGYEVVAIKRFN